MRANLAGVRQEFVERRRIPLVAGEQAGFTEGGLKLGLEHFRLVAATFPLAASDIAQIQRKRKVAVRNFRRQREFALLMAVAEKSGEPPRFRLIAVYWKSLVVSPARMRNVIGATAQAALIPSVVKIEPQRRVRA